MNSAITAGSRPTLQKPIANTLVVALKIVVGNKRFDFMTKLSNTQEGHPV
jgi:hypothetical protein